MSQVAAKDALWTPAFILICLSNFLTFFAFYLLLPVLPTYLLDVFRASPSVSGAVLASYTLAALAIRPFSGFIADTVARKPLHVACLLLFVAQFGGYLLASSLLLFTLLRTTHGLAFGMVTTSGSTLAIDVMPANRRGEGIAFFGVTSSIAMAVGPMGGLFVLKAWSYPGCFVLALIAGLLGWLLALFVRTKPHQPVPHRALSLDRFFLFQGVHGSVSLLFAAFLYGALLTYVALYAREVGLQDQVGHFFVLLAIGVGLSRVGSGRLIDRGHLLPLILSGKLILIVAGAAFVLLPVPWVFNLSSVLLGMGSGLIGPCYQNLFVNLAGHHQRGTASSTFFTAWDMGIGLGALAGGAIAQAFSYRAVMGVGTALVAVSLGYFLRFTAAHYRRHRLSDK